MSMENIILLLIGIVIGHLAGRMFDLTGKVTS